MIFSEKPPVMAQYGVANYTLLKDVNNVYLPLITLGPEPCGGDPAATDTFSLQVGDILEDDAGADHLAVHSLYIDGAVAYGLVPAADPAL